MHIRRLRTCLLIACLCAAVLAAVAQSAAAEGNGLALTPPMGWNDWYSVYCGVNAQLVEQTAQEMVADGMKAAGYDYVNIDDCWMAPSRDASGNLVPDPTRFPGGIAPVAAYVHSLGMKLGIYEDAGTTTCAGLPGSFGHEAQDAATFASWGVDYVKYDRCNIPYGDFPGESEEQVQQTLYARMSNGLEATGRPIVFSMCNPDPGDDPWEWGAPISNLWRTTTDIQDNFGSMLANFEGTVGHFRDAGPGAWNDPDMLQIGNGGSSLRGVHERVQPVGRDGRAPDREHRHRSVDEGRARDLREPVRGRGRPGCAGAARRADLERQRAVGPDQAADGRRPGGAAVQLDQHGRDDLDHGDRRGTAASAGLRHPQPVDERRQRDRRRDQRVRARARRRDVHGERASRAARAQARPAHGAIARLRLGPAPARTARPPWPSRSPTRAPRTSSASR